MKYFKKIVFGTITGLLLVGCMTTQPTVPEEQTSTFIVMKTPVLRYADQGFVHKGMGVTKVEIYASGVAVMKLEMTANKICNGSGLFSCMSKAEFNKRYLSSHYPDSTLENIFRGEKIFAGANVKAIAGGFEQNILKAGVYALKYTVLKGNIVFRDTISNILIKVKDNK
jgi:hypothetical protein